MYKILFYETVDNYLELRAQYRAEHLALVERYYNNGILVMAGALADPYDAAILVFKTESELLVEEFAKSDPYVKNGLIKTWKIRQWNVVIGG
jgi:uncharacterized protein YciI